MMHHNHHYYHHHHIQPEGRVGGLVSGRMTSLLACDCLFLQTRGQTASMVSELTTTLQDGMGRKNGDIFVSGFY